MQLNYDLPAEWKLSNGFRYRESETARIGLFPNAPVTGASRLASLRAGVLASVPGATDVQLRYTNSPDQVFDLVAQNGNALVSDGAMRQVFVPLDEWVNDLRLLRDFEIGGQRHGIALGVYYAKVDETFQRYSANALLDVRDRARLLDVVAVNAAGDVLATITEDGITRYGSEYANGTGESTTYALYASDEWQINDQWRVDVGARYEKVSTDGRAERSAPVNLGLAGTADDSILTGTGVFDPFDRDFDDIGWSTGVNWQFTEQSGVFARYTSTFRLPSVGSFISSATATPVIQTMDFIEAGYKLAAPGLSLYVTAFNTKFDSFSFTDTVFEGGRLRAADDLHRYRDVRRRSGGHVARTRLARRRLQRHVAEPRVRRLPADDARQRCACRERLHRQSAVARARSELPRDTGSEAHGRCAAASSSTISTSASAFPTQPTRSSCPSTTW